MTYKITDYNGMKYKVHFITGTSKDETFRIEKILNKEIQNIK